MSGLILPYNGVFPRLEPRVFVAGNASVVGDVEIGEGSSVWYAVTVRGDVNVIRVGRRTNLQDGTTVHCNHDGQGTHIGDDVTVGHMALLHDCTLEDRAFVGMRAVVMDGAIVESDAMVAAGALVTPGKRVRSGELWSGAPAKKMRDLTREEIDRFLWSSRHYAELARQHLESYG